MHYRLACEAIAKRRCLEIQYDGYSRIVEVHACGVSTAGHTVIRAWQISGGSASGETRGWKLLRLDDTRRLSLMNEASHAPRQGYQHGDRDMVRIFCQL